MRLIWIGLGLSLCSCLALSSCARRQVMPQGLSGRAMGCDWNLQWRGALVDGDATSLQREVAAVLEHWEQVLSTWREDSDLMCYNRGAQASRDLNAVLQLAERMKQQTGGAFDPAILARLQALGFGPPSTGQVGRGLDLSSLGKGYAVDRVAEMLRHKGIHDFLFRLAGEMVAGDGSWVIAIEHPEPGPSRVLKRITLCREAIATSGNYRQFVSRATGVSCHILDPRTGESVQREPSSVTVRGPSAALASAWATSLYVLGPDAHGPAGFSAEWHWGHPWPAASVPAQSQTAAQHHSPTSN